MIYPGNRYSIVASRPKTPLLHILGTYSQTARIDNRPEHPCPLSLCERVFEISLPAALTAALLNNQPMGFIARQCRCTMRSCMTSDHTSGFVWLASAWATFATLRMGPLSRLFLPNHTALSVRSLLSSPKNTDWLLHGSSGLRRPLSPARPRREHPQQRTCRQALYQPCPPPSFAQEKRARGRS